MVVGFFPSDSLEVKSLQPRKNLSFSTSKIVSTPPKINIEPAKWWFGRWVSSSRGVFSGSMLIFRGCRYFFLHGPKLVLYQSFWLTYMHSVYPSDRPRKWVLTCYTTTFWGLCWPAISHVQLNNKMMTTNWTNLVLFHYSRRITTLW